MLDFLKRQLSGPNYLAAELTLMVLTLEKPHTVPRLVP